MVATAPVSGPGLFARLRLYAQLTRLNRPVGSLLLLWPTAWALWLAASGWPGWHLAGVFGAGVVLMRSAGCAINDYFDRDFDPHVSRTRARPLAEGALAPAEALGVFAVLSMVSFGLVLTLPVAAIVLSVPALVLAGCYPLAKRYTYLPQVVLGLAFGWGIPLAFVATLGHIPAYGWLLFIGNAFWTVAYDTFYAMTDRDDDLRCGVKSSAILFGAQDLAVVALLHLSALATLALAGWNAGLAWPYYAGLGAAGAVAVYLHVISRSRTPQAAFRAFLRSHWFGAAVFAGLVAALART